jgi:hypothetical protein
MSYKVRAFARREDHPTKRIVQGKKKKVKHLPTRLQPTSKSWRRRLKLKGTMERRYQSNRNLLRDTLPSDKCSQRERRCAVAASEILAYYLRRRSKSTRKTSQRRSVAFSPSLVPWYSPIAWTKLIYCDIAHQETLCGQRELEEVQSCE